MCAFPFKSTSRIESSSKKKIGRCLYCMLSFIHFLAVGVKVEESIDVHAVNRTEFDMYVGMLVYGVAYLSACG